MPGEQLICPRTEEECHYLNEPRYIQYNPERFVQDKRLCQRTLNEGICGFLNLVGSIEMARDARIRVAWGHMASPDSMSDEQRDNS